MQRQKEQRYVTNAGLRDPDQILARLVTSFATQEDEINRFAHLCQELTDEIARSTST